MALLKCHECSNQVSSEAKICPNCGAGAKRQSGRLIKVIVMLIAIGALIGGLAVHRISIPGKSDEEQAEKPSQALSLPWVYFTSRDAITGKEITIAQTSSLNTEILNSPYGLVVGATLTLRRHPRNETDVYVSLEKGEILCRKNEECTIAIGFDNRMATKYFAFSADDGSTDVIHIKDYARIVAAIKKSKRMIVELPLQNDGNRSWEFNVAGFAW